MNENRLKRGIKEMGLDELLSDIQRPHSVNHSDHKALGASFQILPITQVQPNPKQPRKIFDEEKLNELADSIRTQGIIQPIVVRLSKTGDYYQIIAGERRWRASQLVGLTEIPAIIREISDESAVAVALIENIQRHDLNPIEEAQALHRLIEEFYITHQKIADMVGKSRASVTNSLRLLNLDKQVKTFLSEGDISVGHAKLLLSLPDEKQVYIAQMIIAKELSVRETEQLIQNLDKSHAPKKLKTTLDPDIVNLQNNLSETLGAQVAIKHTSKGKGSVIIHYHSVDELQGILEHIK